MRLRTLLFLLLPSLALSGCELAGGLIRAGFWMGFILVAIVILLVFWLLRRLGRGRRP